MIQHKIWVNYNDLTVIIVSKGNHPQMAELFRLVKYYNLPRLNHGHDPELSLMMESMVGPCRTIAQHYECNSLHIIYESEISS